MSFNESHDEIASEHSKVPGLNLSRRRGISPLGHLFAQCLLWCRASRCMRLSSGGLHPEGCRRRSNSRIRAVVDCVEKAQALNDPATGLAPNLVGKRELSFGNFSSTKWCDAFQGDTTS